MSGIEGKLYDINTGKLLGTVPDPEVAFTVYIDKVRANISEASHLRYGKCRLRQARLFINRMREKGVECAFDRSLPADSVVLAAGTADEWEG